MLNINFRAIATMIAALLLAASANAAETADSAGKDPAGPDTAETNRNLARQANTVAVADAIDAVLQSNKLNLDIRMNGRTSGHTLEEPVDGR